MTTWIVDMRDKVSLVSEKGSHAIHYADRQRVSITIPVTL